MMKLSEVMAARNVGEFTDENGVTWKLQRTPLRVLNEIRTKCTGPRQLVDPADKSKGFRDGDVNIPRMMAMKVAYALLEPQVDGDTLETKADAVSDELSSMTLGRLFDLSNLVDDIDLSKKVEDEAKN